MLCEYTDEKDDEELLREEGESEDESDDDSDGEGYYLCRNINVHVRLMRRGYD